MIEIGNDLKLARTDSSVSLEEASSDTGIPIHALEQIEEGSIGAFKDIFELKNYLQIYAKYLGLDSTKIIDDFNEYMFEYTSKIPVEKLEKAIAQKEKEEAMLEAETNEIKIVSPYLNPKKENSTTKLIVTIIVIIVLVAITLIWAVKQVMFG